MSHDDSHASPDDTERRGFVKFLAGTLGLILGIVPTGIGIGFFLDPLLRRKAGSSSDRTSGGRKDENGFINLGITPDALPDDGTPIAVKVVDDRVDAWNKIKDVPVGTVWLRKTSDGVLAFNTICPHLGCAIDFRQSKRDFFCPCHTSTFALDGTRQNQIPPRNMDKLETLVKEDAGNTIWLKYQEFRAATPERVPV